MDNWQSTIIWTIGHGDNTSQLVHSTTREIAKRKLDAAEKMLRRNGAHILITELFTE